MILKKLIMYSVIVLFSTITFAQKKQPNLLIIHTDEHNYRTLGCYRDIMSEEQAFIWGKDVCVKTPNIDQLAKKGALCSSFYAASPVCTPSRASFISGLYPIATGSYKNDLPLNDGLVTFAEVLKKQGYATTYVGKWHLDGDAKPGFEPARKFGFDDNRYMFNRGHYKGMEEKAEGPGFKGKFNKKKKTYFYDVTTATDESFTTDFLANRTIDAIKRDKNKPFCIMVSIPDPHGPNKVRPPYDTMYTHLNFKKPHSLTENLISAPEWNAFTKKSVKELDQHSMAQYFGMVKCIDDNVGKIMDVLKQEGLDQNTIVVFTSDHGDLMGEHARHNKGLPYETSAGIPFIMKYPGKVKGSKLINTAYTTADFAPTILSMMGVKDGWPKFHGKDMSDAFLNKEKVVSNTDRIVYITNAASRWVAAANQRYKLVLSPNDSPWLFDLEKDPNELINFYNKRGYKEISERFLKELKKQMQEFDEPLFKLGTIRYK
ncbi:sulfatase [Labilibacter sediminis]|nr:sulfatase [Labilibacter sediminis]